MACCKGKKYYTDLCEKCKNDFGAFSYTDLGDDYDKFKNTFGESDDSDWFGVTENKKCECGSEAVSAPGHSSWCPKFEN